MLCIRFFLRIRGSCIQSLGLVFRCVNLYSDKLSLVLFFIGLIFAKQEKKGFLSLEVGGAKIFLRKDPLKSQTKLLLMWSNTCIWVSNLLEMGHTGNMVAQCCFSVELLDIKVLKIPIVAWSSNFLRNVCAL